MKSKEKNSVLPRNARFPRCMALFTSLTPNKEPARRVQFDLEEEEPNDEDFDYLADKAEQGNAEAQFQLAKYLEEKYEYEDDLELASEWYEKAAKQHFPGAAAGLGRVLIEIGGKQNVQKALKVLKWAVKRGDAEAAEELGAFYLDGKLEYFEKGVNLWRQAIAGGRLELRYNLAEELIDSENEADWPEGVAIFEELRAEGDPYSTFYLTEIYEEGEKVPQDLPRAFRCCEEASSDEFPDAMRHLGEMLINGIGCKRDRKKGEALCRRADELEKKETEGGESVWD